MKVSILIPCYNVEAFLPQCLDSVINQTYRDLQIVIVDDGSVDNTFALAQEYAANDSRIEVYHQDNQGVAQARNTLLSKINGDYFLFVDSDDWIEPDMVEFLVSCTEPDGADIVTCDAVIDESKIPSSYKLLTYNRETAIELFLYHLEFRGPLWNKFMSVSLLKNGVSFCPEISYGEDALFCWELLKETQKVVYTDRQLYHYRMNGDSISHSIFSEKKLSGHKVWSMICSDTENLFPQYADIAKARFCIEAVLLLRDAGHCHYKEMDKVVLLQNTIKRQWRYLNKVKITSFKMRCYAFVAYRCYWLAGKF